ncbi:MAG TPA: VOC family protein [Candidatus Acidoferrum sp.]|nr:VOC family protein [Candidatus Acidoferrum sp.]
MPKRLPKHSLADQLDEVVQAMLVSLQPRPEKAPHRDVAPLLAIARELRFLPREEFRATLKSDLQRRTSMSLNQGIESSAAAPAKAVHYMRPGFTSITPYIIVNGASQFIDFLKNAFDGVERLRVPAPDGTLMHSEVAIGNGMIEAGDANAQIPPAPTDIHLYVNDADATFDRALAAGATSIYRPTDEHPSGDRWGALEDPFRNRWYIATPRGWTPGPEGLRSIQPYLHLREAHKMIPFLEVAFGAEDVGTHKAPEGRVLHSTMRIGNATLEIDEAHGEYQPKPCVLHVYVPDADAMYTQALRAGATSVEPPTDKPYGDRSAGVKDPFGNTWYLNTYLGQ